MVTSAGLNRLDKHFSNCEKHEEILYPKGPEMETEFRKVENTIDEEVSITAKEQGSEDFVFYVS